MATMVGFILKVFLLSLLISMAIKYLAPPLAIPASTTNAVVAIAFPPLVMGLALWRRNSR